MTMYRVIHQETKTYMNDVEAETEQEAAKLSQDSIETWVELDAETYVYDVRTLQ